MTAILAIDPGPTQSGWVWFDGTVRESGTEDNHDLLTKIYDPLPEIAIERFEARGMPIGEDSIETIIWTGRFLQAAMHHRRDFVTLPRTVHLIRRRNVKLHLCGTSRAKDPNVRQALIDRLGPPGRKATPGPTYGVAGDAWAALGVAVTVWDGGADATMPIPASTRGRQPIRTPRRSPSDGVGRKPAQIGSQRSGGDAA